MFKSFLLAGFECSAFVKPCGMRLDMLEETKHAALAKTDYAGLTRLGIKTARDGLRWHLIDRGGRYDWTSAMGQVEAANEAGVSVIWDLNHYDCPDGIDIWESSFVPRFADYAEAAVEFLAGQGQTPLHLCPINEISYWAWAGGDQALFHPCAEGRGLELKIQLVRAFIAAAKRIRAADPTAMIVTAEPLVHVVSTASHDGSWMKEAQGEAVDMILGVCFPELDGAPDLVDAIGVNYYPFNQWYADGPAIPFGHIDYRALSDMLVDVHERWQKPMLITETAAENSAKSAWLSYVVQETLRARRLGVPLEAICLYPIVSFPLWFTGQPGNAGLWSAEANAGDRMMDTRFRDAILEQAARLRRETGQQRFLLPFRRAMFGS
jgi:hypothetical protein